MCIPQEFLRRRADRGETPGIIALDTNVVVRFLTNDDAIQARRARRLIEQNEVVIPLTVLLEAEWVLRAAYGFNRRKFMLRS